jgi:hypothetical protein
MAPFARRLLHSSATAQHDEIGGRYFLTILLRAVEIALKLEADAQAVETNCDTLSPADRSLPG